jgi:MFS family permease
MTDRTEDGDAAVEDAERSYLETRFGGRSGEELLRRARRRRVIWLSVGLAVAGLVGGLVGGLHSGSAHVQRQNPSTWREVLGLVLLLAGAMVEVVGFVRLYRRGFRRVVRHSWRSPLLALPLRERRRVLRQMRGQLPLEPGDVAVVRGHARRVDRTRDLQVVLVGIAVIQLGQSVGQRPLLAVLSAVFVVGVLVVTALYRRDLDAARRFLAEHPPRP